MNDTIVSNALPAQLFSEEAESPGEHGVFEHEFEDERLTLFMFKHTLKSFDAREVDSDSLLSCRTPERVDI